MSDPSAAARAAQYLRAAAAMQVAADRAFDPEIVAGYLQLTAKWLRLAEEAQRGVDVIDRTEQDSDGDSLS
jgi:hypothetical protein